MTAISEKSSALRRSSLRSSVDDALVLDGLNDGLQLGGGFLLGIFAAVLVLERKRNKTDEQRNEEDDRREHDHKKTDDGATVIEKRFAFFFAAIFGAVRRTR